MGDTLAAIDVGTNSLHLVVARVAGHDRFEVIDSEKEMVRLGRGGGDMKLLTPDAIERGVAALARFRQIADIYGAPVRAVATSAVREAENHDEFLERAARRGGRRGRGDLGHRGGPPHPPRRPAGRCRCSTSACSCATSAAGSTELLLGERGEVLASRSFKLGAVRLTDRFFPGERVHAPAPSARAAPTSARLLAVFAKEIEAHGFEVAVGSSGTIEAVGRRWSHAADRRAAAADAQPLRVHRRRARRGRRAPRRRPARVRRAAPSSPGLDAKRADIILAGALILEGVVDALRRRAR